MPEQQIHSNKEPRKFIVKDPPVICEECGDNIDYMAVREDDDVYHRDCYLEMRELGLDHKIEWAPGEPTEADV